MPVPTTNVTLTSIQTEFGGANPINMSEYYRGGANVPSGQATSTTDGTPISTSGTIRMGMFRGLSEVSNFPTSGSFFTSDYDGSFGPPGTAACNFTLNPNGTVSYAGNGTTGLSNWYTPTTTNIGASYWVRATITSSNEFNPNGGTVNRGGTTGTWLQLSSSRQWSLSVTGFEISANTSYSFDFSTSSSGTPIVATVTGSLVADFANLN